MTRSQINSEPSKSRGLITFEYVLLGICLCVIALRTTFTEGPPTQSTSQPINIGGSVYTLAVSAVLLFSFVIWFVWSFCSKRFVYRFTAIEVGLLLFVLSAVIAGFAASNKRAAITGFATLFAPMLMAVLLVQILDSHSKIKLLLVCIAALAVVSAWQSSEQFVWSNQMTIEQYEKDPETILAPLGIEPGSFGQMLFEHRLYSRGIRGFFVTSNSAGSFALLASFAALALFLGQLKKPKSSSLRSLIKSGLVVVVVIAGLAMTKSKGAIAAAMIAAAVFIVFLCFADWLKAHRKAILAACILIALAACSVVVAYGLAHDRLPGGNSMLVRWQYWTGAAKMYADHPITGIGPGNFASFYPHYKIASAPETVADPHNFLLSIITQYGPLGLIAFLALIFLPLWKAISPAHSLSAPKTNHAGPPFKKLAIASIILISLALLIIRPIVITLAADTLTGIIDLAIVIFTLYIAPLIAFAVGFLLLTADSFAAPQEQSLPLNTNITTAALFCAALGLLIHNTIDFAIFEPPVFTAFCAIIACLLALTFNEKSRSHLVLKPGPIAKLIVAVGGLVLFWAYFNFAFVPVATASAKTKQALKEPKFAHQLLAEAAEADPLDPVAPNLNGRLYLRDYEEMEKNQSALLERAAERFLDAAERNPADFKNFERLTDTYNLLADSSTLRKDYWLNKAFDAAGIAVKRYPGCARLRFELAKIAEKLGKTNVALDEFKKAVEIEDSFRRQFRQMYPGRRTFSRIGEEKYMNAKKRIEKLSPQPTP
jgi:O-antigen ligase